MSKPTVEERIRDNLNLFCALCMERINHRTVLIQVQRVEPVYLGNFFAVLTANCHGSTETRSVATPKKRRISDTQESALVDACRKESMRRWFQGDLRFEGSVRVAIGRNAAGEWRTIISARPRWPEPAMQDSPSAVVVGSLDDALAAVPAWLFADAVRAAKAGA